MRTGSLLLAAAVCLYSPPALPGGWDAEIRGFVLGAYAARVHDGHPSGPEGRNFLLAEERLRLDLGLWASEAEIRVRLDAVHDTVARGFDLDLREAYLDFTGEKTDFRFGRQIVTWGVGDLLFINDVFPKNWVSFFSGRPLEYLKAGVDALRARHSSEVLNAELLLIPGFTPDTLPGPGRFFLHDDFAGVAERREALPDTGVGDPEVALRLYRRLGRYDVSFFAYRGYWRTPGQRPDDAQHPALVTHIFPALSTYGFSVQGQALGGVVSFEAGYHDSRDDPSGRDPAVPNSRARFLIGYQRQLAEDFTLGLQYYAEATLDFSEYRSFLPPGQVERKRLRDTITVSLNRFLRHHTWEVKIFAFYSPAERDYLVQPGVRYRVSDRMSAALGANLFGGREATTFFGQFDRNDNVYLTVRYDF